MYQGIRTDLHRHLDSIREKERREVAPAPAQSSDDAMIEVIMAPLSHGETAMIGNARKERELAALMSRLDVLESRMLYRRLLHPACHDRLACAFARFVIDRQQRLLQVLTGARRRAAMSRR